MRFNVSRPSDVLHCVWLISAATFSQRDMRDEMEQHWADRRAVKVANKERSSAALSEYTTVNPFWIKENKEETFLVIEAAPDALHIDHCLLFLFFVILLWKYIALHQFQCANIKMAFEFECSYCFDSV